MAYDKYDKNVFILGAGASVAAGAPLLSEFMLKARELLGNYQYSGLDEYPDDKKAFETVFEWRSTLYRVLRRLNIDFDNLEDLFSLVDMSGQFGNKQASKVRKALTRLACRTIELSVVVHEHPPQDPLFAKGYTANTEYMKLALWIADRKEKGAISDSIITLNYDTLMEQALEDAIYQRGFTYGAPWHEPIPSYQCKVLKLHGSINWATCSRSRCKYPYADTTIDVITRDSDEYYMHPTRYMYEKPCPKCKNGKLETFIVPPTWDKSSYGTPLQKTWKAASEEIEEATRLIIIGYSLPETDSYFKYLLATGLSENRLLEKLIVVDPAPGELLEQHYREFLAPNFGKRNFIFHPMTLQKWLDEKLMGSGIPQ